MTVLAEWLLQSVLAIVVVKCRKGVDKLYTRNDDLLLYRLKRIQGLQGQACARLGLVLTGGHYLIAAVHVEGTITLGERSYPVNRDAFYYCPPGTNFSLTLAPREESILFLIAFDAFRIPSAGQSDEYSSASAHEENGPLFPDESRLVSSERALQLCRSLQELRQRGATSSHVLLMQSQMHELLHLIASDARRQGEDLLDRLERSRAYMRNAFSTKLTIDALARAINISPKYYMELFSRHYGMSAMRYLGRIRIEAAKRLLARGSGKLRDIAHACGFGDEFYFSRRFKLETGITPAAFMRSRRMNIAVLDSIFLGMLAPLHFVPGAAPLHPVWRAHHEEIFGDDVEIRLSIGRRDATVAENVETLLRTNRSFDLILCAKAQERHQLRKLEVLGRVLVFDTDAASWREPFLQVAESLGASSEAVDWLSYYDQTITRAFGRLSTCCAGQRILFLLVEGADIFIHYDRTPADILFGELELSPATAVRPNVPKPIKIAELTAINPDYLFVLVYQDDETINTWDRMQADEDWLELTAVRSGRMHALSPFPWRDDSPLSRLLIVEEALKLLTEDCP